MHPNFTIKNLLPKRKRFVRLTPLIYFYVKSLKSTIMNAPEISFMIEKGETLPIEAQRHIIRIRHLELFKRYIKTHFIAPEVEPDLLKTSARELLSAYIDNGNWLSAPVQRLMLEDEYIGAFKLYTAKTQLKNTLQLELIKPSRFMQYEIYLNNGNYLYRDAEDQLLKPENIKALTRYISGTRCSVHLQQKLLKPEHKDIFELYLQYHRLSPDVEAKLLEPENFACFLIYNKRYALIQKNQRKMLNSKQPELLQTFLKRWNLCKSVQLLQKLNQMDVSLKKLDAMQQKLSATQS